MIALGALLAGPAPAEASHEQKVREVADDCDHSGSSNATGYASNKRMVRTKSGRQLAIYDPHGFGLHLRWRDPGKGWKNTTRGAVSDGNIPMTDGPNDRPASIAVTTASGVQRAWIVWAGPDFVHDPLALKMRRLTQLNNPSGPLIGPEVTLEPKGLGNVRADITFERRASGPRGVVTWLRKTDGSYEIVTGWLSNLSARPVLTNQKVHYTTTSDKRTATLVPTPSGVALVAQAGSLRMFTHSSTDGLSTWGGGTNGVDVASQAKPSAIVLPSGAVLAAVEGDVINHVVEVVRFNPAGTTASTVLETADSDEYKDPSLAATGDGALLAMVRSSDDALVTRRLRGSKWRGDVVELTNEGGGDYAWPSLLRKAGSHVNMLIDAGRCPTNKNSNAVISYSRSL